MDRAKTALVALTLCALCICALGVASAQAEGQTAFGCVEGTGKPEFNANCEAEEVGGGWITEAIKTGVSTGVEGDSVGETRIGATISLVLVEIICEKAH